MIKTHKKTLILLILKILQENTDCNPAHQLRQKDIIKLLKDRYDMDADRKAVKRNLDNLVDCGYQIRHDKGWYMEHDFKDSELRLLIDSLLFSKTIPSDQRRELIGKIELLSNNYFRAKVKHICNLPVTQPPNSQIFTTIDVLDDAISKGLQVEFSYCSYNTQMQMQPKIDPATGKNKIYTMNPYQIVASNSRYYLICNVDKYDAVAHYRLDRITDIKLLDSPVKNIKKVKGLENGINLPTHMAEHIYMFSGDSVRVKFRSNKSIVGEIIDWFGCDVKFSNETADTVDVLVRVNEQAMRYWALQFGIHVEILEPASFREIVRADVAAMNTKYEKPVD